MDGPIGYKVFPTLRSGQASASRRLLLAPTVCFNASYDLLLLLGAPRCSFPHVCALIWYVRAMQESLGVLACLCIAERLQCPGKRLLRRVLSMDEGLMLDSNLYRYPTNPSWDQKYTTVTLKVATSITNGLAGTIVGRTMGLKPRPLGVPTWTFAPSQARRQSKMEALSYLSGCASPPNPSIGDGYLSRSAMLREQW